jgi:HEAT repeat protein
MQSINLAITLCFVFGCTLGCESQVSQTPPTPEPTYGGKTLAEWSAQAKDKEPQLRAQAAEGLLGISKLGTRTGPPRLAFTKEESERQAKEMLREAQERRKDPGWVLREARRKQAIAALTELLGDQEKAVRLAAIAAIRKVAWPDSTVAIPALTRLLTDEEAEVRVAAAETLGQLGHLGPWGAPAIPALAERLRDKHPDVRRAAALALITIGRAAKAETAIPPLTKLLRDEQADIRSAAARTLGTIGPAAKSAVPPLTDLLRDKEDGVRLAAAEALGNIGPEAQAAIPALTELLADSSQPLREVAAKGLEKIKKDAPSDAVEKSP